MYWRTAREDLELFAKFVDKSLLGSLDTIVAEAYVQASLCRGR